MAGILYGIFYCAISYLWVFVPILVLYPAVVALDRHCPAFRRWISSLPLCRK